MSEVFKSLCAEARRERGFIGVLGLWVREVVSLAKFAVRDRFMSSRTHLLEFADRSGQPFQFFRTPPANNLVLEVRWAWRGVRSRGARGVLIIALLAIVIAANGTVFAFVDSLLLNKAPYPGGERLVEIATQKPQRSIEPFITAGLLDEWRKQTDLFVNVDAWTSGSMFVTINGLAEFSTVTYLTPGVTGALGINAKWGRTFLATDSSEAAETPVLISEPLARKCFGDPSQAIGKILGTTAQPLRIIGVMSAGFYFPVIGQYSLGIWAPLDPYRIPAGSLSRMTSIARLQPKLSPDAATLGMRTRSEAIAAAAGAPRGYMPFASPLHVTWTASSMKTLMLILLGAAAALLLAGCANVASLELAAAHKRSRRYAVQLAIGASRATLARVAILEGALLIGAATVIGLSIASAVLNLIGTSLPAGVSTANPIDLDVRAFTYVIAIATVTWLMVSLPIVIHATRSSVTSLLKTDDRASTFSRGSMLLRRGLTTTQVTLAVLLVIGALLYGRSYRTLISIDKGFDSTNLASIGFTIPPNHYTTLPEANAFADNALRRIKEVPGVLMALHMQAPPGVDNASRVEIESDTGQVEKNAWQRPVDPVYFSVLRVPLKQGRVWTSDDPPGAAVVTEAFARRFWPDMSAVGRTFRIPATGASFQVTGVAGDIRPSLRPQVVSAPALAYYVGLTSATGTLPMNTQWRAVNLTVRTDSPTRAAAVLAAARSADPRVPAFLDVVDDTYANPIGDVLLATRVVGAFGTLTFVIAVMGVYGVMAFLVSSRRREIGIRMALGATRRDIARLVVGSSMRMVVAGSVIGVIAAVVASHWIAAQVFGVRSIDPLTYAVVVAAILSTALFATWRPAHQAAALDPAVTLRSE